MPLLSAAPDLPDPAREQALYELGQACALLEKAGAAPRSSPSLVGRLYLSQSGWGVLSVPNSLIRGLFDALHEPGVELPLRDGKLTGHVSVFSDKDLTAIGGPDRLTERGHQYRWQLGPVKVVEPTSGPWAKVYYATVVSPDLARLRRTYNLPARPHDGKYDFHATFGVVPRGRLSGNGPEKAAAGGEEKQADLLPGGKADDEPDARFDPDGLAQGIDEEKEHTNSPALAREIAKDHLVGHGPDYYQKLRLTEAAPLSRLRALAGRGSTISPPATLKKQASPLLRRLLAGFGRGLAGRLPAPAALLAGTRAVTNPRFYPTSATARPPRAVPAPQTLARWVNTPHGRGLFTGTPVGEAPTGLAAQRLAEAGSRLAHPAVEPAKASLPRRLASLAWPGAPRPQALVYHQGRVQDPRSFVERWAGLDPLQSRALGGAGAFGGGQTPEAWGNRLRSLFQLATKPAWTPSLVRRSPGLEAWWRRAPLALTAATGAGLAAHDSRLVRGADVAGDLAAAATGSPLGVYEAASNVLPLPSAKGLFPWSRQRRAGRMEEEERQGE